MSLTSVMGGGRARAGLGLGLGLSLTRDKSDDGDRVIPRHGCVVNPAGCDDDVESTAAPCRDPPSFTYSAVTVHKQTQTDASIFTLKWWARTLHTHGVKKVGGGAQGQGARIWKGP